MLVIVKTFVVHFNCRHYVVRLCSQAIGTQKPHLTDDLNRSAFERLSIRSKVSLEFAGFVVLNPSAVSHSHLQASNRN